MDLYYKKKSMMAHSMPIHVSTKPGLGSYPMFPGAKITTGVTFHSKSTLMHCHWFGFLITCTESLGSRYGDLRRIGGNIILKFVA